MEHGAVGVKTKGSQIKAEFTPRETRVRECEMGCPDLAGGLKIFREDFGKNNCNQFKIIIIKDGKAKNSWTINGYLLLLGNYLG